MSNLFSREPVRAALYPILILIVGFIAAKGWIGGDDAAFIVALGTLILGAFGIEVARSQVSPVDPK